MSELNSPDAGTFTVICRWYPPGDACLPWQFISVVIGRCASAQDAANNACLYVIWEQQGRAEPWLVIQGARSLSFPDSGEFDAEDFDETITFTGTIVCKREFG